MNGEITIRLSLVAWTFLDVWRNHSVMIVLAFVAIIGAALLKEIAERKNVAAAIAFAAITLSAIGFLIYWVPANRRDSIHRVLTYDKSLMTKIESKASTLEWWLGLSAKSKAEYASRLQLIPLSGCPADFVEVFKRHVDAWQRAHSPDIARTWAEVLDTARRYQVDLDSLRL